MAAARRLFLRLFLEGVEVPVIGARVTISEGMPAACTMQIVPTTRAMELHPRTLVHLFCADIVNMPLTEDSAVAREYTKVNEDPMYDLENYKLLFHGLLIGFQYLKQGTQRSIVLQCLDCSIAWDTTYQYMLTYGPNGSGILGSNATFIGANTNLFDDIINDPVSVTSSLLQRKHPKTKDFQKLKGLLAGIISVIEAIGGIPGDFRGINDFNTVEELRNRLLYQVTTDENDSTSANLFARKAFDQWLTNSLGGMGGLMSTRDILNMVMKYIYYGMVPCPVAHFRPAGEDTYTKASTESDLTGNGRAIAVKWRKNINILYRRVDEGLAGIGATTSAPNEARLGGVGEAVVGESAFDEGSEIAVLTGVAAASNEAILGRKRFVSLAAASAEDVGFFLTRIRTDLGNYVRGMEADLVGLPVNSQVDRAFYYLKSSHNTVAVERPVLSAPVAALDLLRRVRDNLDIAVRALDAALNATTTTTTEVEYTTAPRLNTQILRPDVWYVAPPRCNVLFPEHYNVFQFNRQMLRECTRYQLRTSMELIGPDPLLDYYYKAPDLSGSADISRGDYFADTAIIMKHEVHSGIVPKMHHEGEVSLYASKSIKDYIKELVGKDKDAATLRNSYAQRVAHWNFFRFRFMPRMISFTGQFNPLPVAGFPMAIIDRGYIPPDGVSVQDLLKAINDGDIENVLALNPDVRTVGRSIEGDPIVDKVQMPTQFLGLVTNLEHVADQSGGHTTGQLNFCRTHKSLNGNDDEFLNIRLAEKRLASDKIAGAVFLLNYKSLYEAGNKAALTVLAGITPQLQTEAAALSAALDDGLGPPPADLDWVGGESSPTWTDLVQGETLEKTLQSKLSTLAESEGAGVGGEVRVGSFGLQGTIRQIRTNGRVTRGFDGQLYYEEAALSEDVEEMKAAISTIIPPEEAIAPPWISELYANKNIGEKVYTPFFGIGSIVDDQQFLVEETDPKNQTPEQIEAGLDQYENYGGLAGDITTVGVQPESASRVVVDAKSPFSNLVSFVATNDEMRHVSIAMALDTLAVIYGMIRARGLDTSGFVWNYVNRPIATLPDLLGDRDYQLDDTGRALGYAEIEHQVTSADGPILDEAGNQLPVGVTPSQLLNQQYPKEGFHSRSVASLTNLVGLLTDENGDPVDLSREDQKFKRADGRGGEESIAPSLDQRVERKSRVLAYVSELKTRALVG